MVDLGTLVGSERVLDGELVQAELVGELVQLLLGRSAEVHPHDGVGTLQVLGDVGDRKALRLEHAFAVHPRVGHGSVLRPDFPNRADRHGDRQCARAAALESSRSAS